MKYKAGIKSTNKKVKALIKYDIFKQEYGLIFVYIDTINNIRRKLYTKFEDEFVFDLKCNYDIIDSRRLTINYRIS